MPIAQNNCVSFAWVACRHVAVLAGLLTVVGMAVIGCNAAEPEISEHSDKPVALISRTNIDVWTHPEHLPNKKPLVVGVRGVLSQRWRDTQIGERWEPANLLLMFDEAFRRQRLPHLIHMPVGATSRDSLTYQGTEPEIIGELRKEIAELKIDAIFLLHIDRYDPGTGRSRHGHAYLPEVAVTAWLVTADGERVWTASAGSRADDTTGSGTAAGEVYAFREEAQHAIAVMAERFAEFWSSATVRKHFDAAPNIAPSTELWKGTENTPWAEPRINSGDGAANATNGGTTNAADNGNSEPDSNGSNETSGNSSSSSQ